MEVMEVKKRRGNTEAGGRKGENGKKRRERERERE
jgi:hypothetical protein